MNLLKSFSNIIFVSMMIIFFLKNANGAEFYELNEPYRDILSKNYDNDIDEDEVERKNIDVDLIGNDFLQKSNKLYAEKMDTEIKIARDKEEKMTKRQRFEYKKKNGLNDYSNEDIKIKEKKIDKTFIDSWLPDNSTKPMDMVGAYTSFKFWLAMPMPTKISVNEITGNDGSYKNNQLFTGNAKYNLMPAFFVSVGNDRFKWWRWEMELGYLPLMSSGISGFTPSKEMSDYIFSVDKKDLSMHLMTLSFNNFLQHDFFNKRLVGFIGLGAGVGYAWSMGRTLSSNFVMPIVTGHLGLSFMVGKKSKMNISYTIMYSQMSLPNRYGFSRGKTVDVGDNMIRGGKMKFSQLLINGISIEYLFYTA